MGWASLIVALAPPVYQSLAWIEMQGKDYVINRQLERIAADAQAREELARAEAVRGDDPRWDALINDIRRAAGEQPPPSNVGGVTIKP